MTRNIPFGRPWITDDDRAAVLEVLNGTVLTHGPQCAGFEADFAAFMAPDGGAHCVSVSSCMAALHLAWLHFGIGPGDEVVVPAMTHTATVHAVEWVGARPVFVDCDPATGNLTAERIERALTPQTKAICVVHFVGIPCDMPAIRALADARNLRLVEDCALAVGARIEGTHVGLFGDAGCFSFYPVKHLTTGEGGLFVTRHPEVAKNVARLRAFGVDRSHTERAMPGMYDVPELGLNYRMSEMQAALGRAQMRRIGENLAGRAASFALLESLLADLPGVRVLDGAGNSHYCLVAVLEAASRNDVAARLKEAGIGTSVYYPHPVPRLQYYRERYGYEAGAFAEAARISDCSLALPVSWHVSEDDLRYIAASLRHALSKVEE